MNKGKNVKIVGLFYEENPLPCIRVMTDGKDQIVLPSTYVNENFKIGDSIIITVGGKQ